MTRKHLRPVVGQVDENQLGLFGPQTVETSRKAAEDNYPRSGQGRARVLICVADSVDGLTDQEIQIALGMGESTERPRRIECVDAGWIIDSGARRPTTTGSEAAVWICTPTGIAAAHRARR